MRSDGTNWREVSRAIFQDFKSIPSTNGYGSLPNGRIDQQGAGASLAITFPLAFNTACRGVVITRIEASGAISYSSSVAGVSTTGFTLYSNGARAGTYYWRAIGY